MLVKVTGYICIQLIWIFWIKFDCRDVILDELVHSVVIVFHYVTLLTLSWNLEWNTSPENCNLQFWGHHSILAIISVCCWLLAKIKYSLHILNKVLLLICAGSFWAFFTCLCNKYQNLMKRDVGSVVAQWYRVLDSRPRVFWVQASPASLHCVLEQDTLILA